MIDAPWWAVLLALVFAAILVYALFVVFLSTFGLPLGAGFGVERLALRPSASPFG